MPERFALLLRSNEDDEDDIGAVALDNMLFAQRECEIILLSLSFYFKFVSTLT